MSSRDHYVSQFHLRGFTDTEASLTQVPWLWVGDCATGSINRRAPKNIAWSRRMFDGPGGQADRTASIEAYLATQVESPAAVALRGFLARAPGQRGSVPGEVGRYLAWAAARNLPMKQLYQRWIEDMPPSEESAVVVPPPDGFDQIQAITRTHRMKHPEVGTGEDVPSDDVERRREMGWRLVWTDDDFLELAHLQAWYFQVRFFPRLQWIILDAPPGGFFVVGDRPVAWGFEGALDAHPNALRHHDVRLVAPLTRAVALLAYHPSGLAPERVNCRAVNRVVASAASQWIAGPTRSIVEEALAQRSS